MENVVQNEITFNKKPVYLSILFIAYPFVELGCYPVYRYLLVLKNSVMNVSKIKRNTSLFSFSSCTNNHT